MGFCMFNQERTLAGMWHGLAGREQRWFGNVVRRGLAMQQRIDLCWTVRAYKVSRRGMMRTDIQGQKTGTETKYNS